MNHPEELLKKSRISTPFPENGSPQQPSSLFFNRHPRWFRCRRPACWETLTWTISLTRLLRIHFQFSSVQSFSHVQLFAPAWTAAHQASLSITNSQSLPKLVSIESVMPSNHLILCRPLLLLPSIFPNIRVHFRKCKCYCRELTQS